MTDSSDLVSRLRAHVRYEYMPAEARQAMEEAADILALREEQPAETMVLTADFTRSLPGGKLDDSEYETIENALDRADAPFQADDGRWLTLAERVEALSASPVIKGGGLGSSGAESAARIASDHAATEPLSQAGGFTFEAQLAERLNDPEWLAKWNSAEEDRTPFVTLLHALRADEGDSVTLLCDNPEGPPNNAIECCGMWTDWQDRRYSGETLRAAVLAAYRAKRSSEAAPISPSEASACTPATDEPLPSPAKPLPADAGASCPWRPIETAPRDGTVFIACNLDHPSFGSWPMHRRVRHRLEKDGEWSMEDLGGWNHISDVDQDWTEGHESGPGPSFSIAPDDLNTSVRYGWHPLPSPATPLSAEGEG